MKSLPSKDGWGNAWKFLTDQSLGASGTAAQVYMILSSGKDGTFQSSPNGGATTKFDCDIIYSNGAFVQYPEGVQAQ